MPSTEWHGEGGELGHAALLRQDHAGSSRSLAPACASANALSLCAPPLSRERKVWQANTGGGARRPLRATPFRATSSAPQGRRTRAARPRSGVRHNCPHAPVWAHTTEQGARNRGSFQTKLQPLRLLRSPCSRARRPAGQSYGRQESIGSSESPSGAPVPALPQSALAAGCTC